jgi:formate dehydrogenase subunit gamma
MLICVATAAVLYLGPLSVAVGRRRLVADVHIYSGIALPVPVLLGWLRASFRRDARLLNRFTRDDWRWLASRTRRDGRIPVGKFNAGQKLNASFTVGAIIVMLGTGMIMRYANGWPVSYRTGATFVHDWLAYGIVAVLVGHLYFASRDPAARAGMRTGWVPRGWARREHSAWLTALDEADKADEAGHPGESSEVAGGESSEVATSRATTQAHDQRAGT